jgi:hypothetical protein
MTVKLAIGTGAAAGPVVVLIMPLKTPNSIADLALSILQHQ